MPRLGDDDAYTVYITQEGEGLDEPLDECCERVVLMGPLEPDDYDQLASDMLEAGVRRLAVGGQSPPVRDFQFLALFGFLGELHVSVQHVSSLGSLDRWTPGLRSLVVEETSTRSLSLDFLPGLQKLESLTLTRHPKFLRVAGELKRLKTLELRSMPWPSLEQMAQWSSLEELKITRGRCPDQGGLAQLDSLRHLDVGQAQGLEDLGWLASLTSLQSFKAHWQPRFVEFPPLGSLRQLRSVHCETLSGLVDVSGLADAPALETAEFEACIKLEPESFRPLAGHPGLRRVRVGAGSDRKNQAIRDILGSTFKDFQGVMK